MGDSDNSSSTQATTAPERPAISLPSRPTPNPSGSNPANPRAEAARVIPRRPRVSFWFGMILAFVFALAVTPAVTAERWLTTLGLGAIEKGETAGITIRVAPFAGQETAEAHIGGGGVVIARGAIATGEQADNARAVVAAAPAGALPYVAFFVLTFVFAAIFSHHMRRSTKGRLIRVQIVSLVSIGVLAIAVKILMLVTSVSILVVPVAMLAMMPTMVLDRITGLATGILAALVTSLLIPFDVSVAILLLVQAATAGLVVAEHPRSRWRAALTAGAVTTLLTAGTYALLTYLTTGSIPRIGNVWHSPLFAAAIGPAITTLLVAPLVPIYQLLVGEITKGKLVELEDLSHPLLRQIATKSPGTWQHSLMMANMAEIAANAIGASGRLVRVGAYFHDLGKSLQPKYFIENLEPGETSPHDQLPPEVSCDAIFAHVTEGIVTARRAGLHERIVDFMHMHHGDGVLEYFWSRCREQGNAKGFTVENFRYPGHPPQSRETAILAICDAVEAASRTLKKPDAAAIDSLVQRIVYGKLHLGQLDESGLSMSDLRQISDSLRETIRHANHGRIEYPWQKAQQDASATKVEITGTQPRLDSLDRKPHRDTSSRPAIVEDEAPIELSRPSQRRVASAEALAATADIKRSGADDDLAIIETAPALSRDSQRAHEEITRPAEKVDPPPEGVRIAFRQPTTPPPMGRARTESGPPPRPRTESDLAGRPPRPRTESELAGVPVGRPRTESGRARTDSGLRGADSPSAARKRAATLPPFSPRSRAPSVQPPGLAVPPPGIAPVVPMAGREASGARPLPAALTTQVGRAATPSESNPSVPSHGEVSGARALPAREPSTPPPHAPDPRAPSSSTPPFDATNPLPYGPIPASRASRQSGLPLVAALRMGEPPAPAASSSLPAVEPVVEGPPLRNSGPPQPVDLENAITNPPPLRRTMMPPLATRLPAYIHEEDLKTTAPRAPVSPRPPSEDHDTGEHAPIRNVGAVEDAGRTEPSMPKLELPLKPPPMSEPTIDLPDAGATLQGDPLRRAIDLASRIDAAGERDEWSVETPVVAPTKAELRALLGVPDVTRRQTIDEIDQLHLAAAASVEESDPEILPPRPIPRVVPVTTEVDPDDIESAIEIAPPARRTALGIAKPPKKSDS